MRRALGLVLAMAGLAHANGRPDAVSTINFKPGDPNEIAAGLTFGLVLSHDAGQVVALDVREGRRLRRAVGSRLRVHRRRCAVRDDVLRPQGDDRWLRVRIGAAGHDVRLADRGLADRRRVLRGVGSARRQHLSLGRRRRDVHDLDRAWPPRRLVGVAEILDDEPAARLPRGLPVPVALPPGHGRRG